MANIANLTDEQFEELVLKAEGPVVVDFWAPWCGPCLRLAPILEEVAAEMADRLTVYKLNTDENQRTPVKYRVMSIPTLIVFKNGQEVDRIVGALPKDVLVRKLEEAIA
ncbi:MAG: thioredoxin [Limnochordales bacterium]|jgi:thioredoxin|nr:thioredoxin [Bacillota bacterium]